MYVWNYLSKTCGLAFGWVSAATQSVPGLSLCLKLGACAAG